jgi:rod shape determining protein RodA
MITSAASDWFSRLPFVGRFRHIDWTLLVAALLIVGAGLVTMNSFVGKNAFFDHQIIWLIVSLVLFFTLSLFDFQFLRRTGVVVGIFLGISVLLLALFALGSVFKGAQSWFNVGLFAIQPSDPAKLAVIILLSKYFSRRHMEIANIRHILVSGFYAGIITLLVLVEPDFGSAIIIASIWFGMVLVSGISKKHLFGLIAVGCVGFFILWNFVLEPYQQQRITTFIHPYADIRGAGYNAYQSTIAVGSGGLLGKGIGYGTQSKLQFLPEYETDFIFAAFAEEWGFLGVLLLAVLYGIVIWRLLEDARMGASNFETLFGLGIAILFMSHIIVHVGMNIGILPVTGTTIPFMSYGGSHLVTEFAALGILMGMKKRARVAPRAEGNEFLNAA